MLKLYSHITLNVKAVFTHHTHTDRHVKAVFTHHTQTDMLKLYSHITHGQDMLKLYSHITHRLTC